MCEGERERKRENEWVAVCSVRKRGKGDKEKEGEAIADSSQSLLFGVWMDPAEKQTAIEIMLGFSGERCHCRKYVCRQQDG